MSCEYCGPRGKPLCKDDSSGEYVDIDHDFMYFKTKNDMDRTKIKYCPKCGTTLTPPQALTLEKLREMAEKQKPVYAISNLAPQEGHWCILDFTFQYGGERELVAIYGRNLRACLVSSQKQTNEGKSG